MEVPHRDGRRGGERDEGKESESGDLGEYHLLEVRERISRLGGDG